MELIKKYNYEDPLHMKGDPFGAADAKVAHVNELITDVNSLTSRVETLENASGSTSEYYINGRILQYDNGTGTPLFLFNVDSHNTPLIDTVDSFGHNTLQGLFAFANTGGGNYSLITGFPILQIETEEGDVSVYFNYYTMTSCVITPTDTLYEYFSQGGRPLIGVAIDNIDFAKGSDLGFFANLRFKAARYNEGIIDTITLDMPSNGANENDAENILSVQIRFSSLIFTPVG